MASIVVSSPAAEAAKQLPAARFFSWAKDGRFALTVGGIILGLNLYAPANPSLLVRLLASGSWATPEAVSQLMFALVPLFDVVQHASEG